MKVLTVNRRRLKAIKNRVIAGRCILDHEEGQPCGRVIYARGLCKSHYNNFMYELAKQRSEAMKLAFEEQNIVDGKLLALGAQRSYTRKSPFSKVGCVP